MRTITFKDPHRQKHFAFFQGMELPYFSLVAPVPCSHLVDYIRENKLHFTSAVVYLLSYAANAIPELRWRIRGQEVVEHTVVHPSFTVQTRDTDVFSFCYVEYSPDFRAFGKRVQIAIQEMHADPSLEDEPGRDDYLFMSAFPWVHFTGFTHPMSLSKRDSVPRIAWGKADMRDGMVKMPVGLQVHHALVDGRHVGQFFTLLESLFNTPTRSLAI